MKTYHFTVKLQGSGENEAEAWDDAVENFIVDPGFPDYAEEIDDEEED
jgi:hypothetical protein